MSCTPSSSPYGACGSRGHLGDLVPGGELSLVAYVDGKRFRGDPARIELTDRRRVTLLFGTGEHEKNPRAPTTSPP